MNLQDTIDQAKAGFQNSKARLLHALANTPGDRLNWSPAPTARTPIQQVAHAASAMKSIHETLDGRTFQANSTAEADRGFRAWEQQFCTREQVLGLLEDNSAAYEAWLDTLTPERLASLVEFPFGLGSAPLTTALPIMASHMDWHTAQIHYIQTIYGDQDWHQ